MSKRRTAEDALKMTPNVADFISGGVPSGEELNSASEDPQGKESQSQVNTMTAVRKTKSKPKRRTNKPASAAAKIQQTPAYDQTLAQARIQKSVRFLPQLIARFEVHCRDEIQSGRKPPTIQDALNDALRGWLADRQPN